MSQKKGIEGNNMENIRYTLDDMERIIADMGDGKSVRLHDYHQSGVTLKITKRNNRPESLINLVTVDFEVDGKSIANTNYLCIDELEDVLNKIRDGETSYFLNNKKTLSELVREESEFNTFYVKSVGRLEDKRALSEDERYTICYGSKSYIAKPDVTRQQIIDREREWSWENSVENMLKLDNDFVYLFGEKNARDVAELAKANNIILSASKWREPYEERCTDHRPNYWQVSGAIKFNVFSSHSGDCGSEAIREEQARFYLDRYKSCSSVFGNKGLNWVISELYRIANNPQDNISGCGNNKYVSHAAEKLNKFAKDLGRYYASQLNKSCGLLQ